MWKESSLTTTKELGVIASKLKGNLNNESQWHHSMTSQQVICKQYIVLPFKKTIDPWTKWHFLIKQLSTDSLLNGSTLQRQAII